MVAFASVAIGLSALAVAVYQAYVTRKHNRLSSLPLPIAEIEWHDDDPKLRIFLTNKGVGPALLIAPVVALRDGEPQPFESDRDKATLLASVNILQAKASAASWLGGGSTLPDGRTVFDVLAPGDRPLLLNISCDLSPAELFERLKRLTFVVHLESVYRDRFTEVIRLASHPPPTHHNIDPSVIEPPRRTDRAVPAPKRE
jgi:hypothetical protein